MSSIETYIGRYSRAETVASDVSPMAASLFRTGWLTYREEETRTDALPSAGDLAARRDQVFAAILSKIPAGITRVLDLGCGDGKFAQALHAARPGVVYRGIDLSLEAIAAATERLEVTGNLPANVELQAGNFVEYLQATTVDWDFIISSNLVLRETPRSQDRAFLQLVDSKAPKGWFLYGSEERMTRPDLQYVMGQALAASTNATEHYFIGAQSFLTGDYQVGRETGHPAYIVRDSTVMDVPETPKRFNVVKDGQFERQRARGRMRENKDMTQYKGVTKDANGLITGDTIVLKANAPADSDLAGVETEQAKLKLIQELQG
jgi:SAM-dependent methyltransferase